MELAGLSGARLYAGLVERWIRDPHEKWRPNPTKIHTTRLFLDTQFCYRLSDRCDMSWLAPIRDSHTRFGKQHLAADPKSAVNGNRKSTRLSPWRVGGSLELYHVNAWGKGYFSITARATSSSDPTRSSAPQRERPTRSISYEVVEGLKAPRLTTPRGRFGSPTSSPTA